MYIVHIALMAICGGKERRVGLRYSLMLSASAGKETCEVKDQ